VISQKETPRKARGFSQNRQNLRLLGQRADHHDHLATFHLRHVFNFADLFHVFCDAFQQLATEVLVGHFTAPETQSDFDFVAVFEEFENVAHFHAIVMGIRVGTELDLFDLDGLLLFPGFGFTLLLFIFELTEVHDLANRRVCVGRNLHEIQTSFVSHGHGFGRVHDTDVFAVCANQADFGRADASVDSRSSVTLRRCVMRSAGYGFLPSMVNAFGRLIYSAFSGDTTAESMTMTQIQRVSPLREGVARRKLRERRARTVRVGELELENSMKNLIFVVIAGAVAVVAYFVLGQGKDDSVTEAPVVETSPAVEAVEEVQQAAEEAVDEAAAGVAAATDAAQEAADEAVQAVTEQVEAVQDAAEEAADAAETAVTEAVEGAADAAADATAAATDAAEDAAAAATDVASEATDATTEAVSEAAESATDVAAQAGDAAATGVADLASVFTADGFDMAKVSEVIDGSSLGALQKASLKTAIESAVNNPEMLTQALDTAKQALGL